ncbi:hypothetical protein ACQCN2_00855 [Brevibacillus ginsengisoli]|uniref:hypothetical protein n=1 Tax=Brevibacillus ginsengisoli TaxID=363854 RepID=UPI003CF3601D
MRKKQPELRLRSHFMIINGEKVEIDPKETDLPDRCKLIFAELITGNKYELIESKEFKTASGS